MPALKAGKATSVPIRRDPPKFSATGERQATFRLRNQKTQWIARWHLNSLPSASNWTSIGNAAARVVAKLGGEP